MITNLSFFTQSYYFQKSSFLAQTEAYLPLSHDYLTLFTVTIFSLSFHLPGYDDKISHTDLVVSLNIPSYYTSNLIYIAFYTFQDISNVIWSSKCPGVIEKDQVLLSVHARILRLRKVIWLSVKTGITTGITFKANVFNCHTAYNIHHHLSRSLQCQYCNLEYTCQTWTFCSLAWIHRLLHTTSQNVMDQFHSCSMANFKTKRRSETYMYSFIFL